MKTRRLFALLLGIGLSLCSCNPFVGSETYDQEVILEQPTCTKDGVGVLRNASSSTESEKIVIPALGHHLAKKHVDPTCLTHGYDLYYCTRCGEEDHRDNYVEPLGHDFVTNEVPASCYHPGYVESYCSRCGADEYEPHEIQTLGHDYKLVETVEPNCYDVGYKVYECSRCDHVHYDDFVAATGHHFVVEETVAPTCLEQGYDLMKCSQCGKKIKDHYSSPLGHDYQVESTVGATCLSSGYDVLTCSRCGDTVHDNEVAALGHSYELKERVEPTCTEEGYDIIECSRCGDQYIDRRVDALGHDHQLKETVPSTCTEEGYDVMECTRCGDSYQTNQTKPKGHHYVLKTRVAPTCLERGYDLMECTDCLDTYQTEFVDALGHDLKLVGHDDPTCTESGHDHFACSRCDYVETMDTEDALGHDLTHHDAKNATCVEGGYEAYDECSRCDYTTYHETSILPHIYDKTYVNPTCTTSGYTLFQCRYCGHRETGEYLDALGHDLIDHPGVSATCDKSGYLAYQTCSRCDYSTYQAIEALGGEHDYVTETIPPTTSSPGYDRHVCTLCGDEYHDNVVPAIGPSRLIAASEMVQDPQCPYEDTLYGERDDDNYFYVIYGGRVSDLPLHVNAGFYVDEGTRRLQAYPRQLNPIVPMDLIGQISKAKNTLFATSAEEMLASSPLSNPSKPIRIIDGSLDGVFQPMLQEKFNVTPMEISDPTNAAFVNSMRDYASTHESAYDFGKSLDEYEVNTYHSFAVVRDFDMFFGVKYSLFDQSVKYCSYLVPQGELSEKHFITGSADVCALPSSMPFEGATSARIDRPTSYHTNHPIVTRYHQAWVRGQNGYAANANEVVPSGGADGGWLLYDCSLDNITEVLEAGYDKVFIRISFNWNRPKLSSTGLLFTVYDGLRNVLHGTVDTTDSGPNKVFTVELWLNANQILSDTTFHLTWNNKNFLFNAGVYDLKISAYYYHQGAYEEGAYTGQTPFN